MTDTQKIIHAIKLQTRAICSHEEYMKLKIVSMENPRHELYLQDDLNRARERAQSCMDKLLEFEQPFET